MAVTVNEEFLHSELLTKSLYDRMFYYMNQYQRLPSGVRLEEANGLEILNCFHSCSLCKLGNDQPCSYFWAIKFLFFVLCSRVNINLLNIADITT